MGNKKLSHETVCHKKDLAPFQPSAQEAEEGVKTITISHEGDVIAKTKPMPKADNYPLPVVHPNAGPIFNHLLESFLNKDIEKYIPVSNRNGNDSILEQHPIKK